MWQLPENEGNKARVAIWGKLWQTAQNWVYNASIRNCNDLKVSVLGYSKTTSSERVRKIRLVVSGENPRPKGKNGQQAVGQQAVAVGQQAVGQQASGQHEAAGPNPNPNPNPYAAANEARAAANEARSALRLHNPNAWQQRCRAAGRGAAEGCGAAGCGKPAGCAP
jgi:hypothetical protein